MSSSWGFGSGGFVSRSESRWLLIRGQLASFSVHLSGCVGMNAGLVPYSVILIPK